jgi:hypothetical protein
LIAAYRAQAVTTALVPPRPGPDKGSRRLDPAREALVEGAIRRVYRTREKPSIAALVRHIAHECRRCGAEPVSRKAVAARIRTLGPRALLRDREGAKAAADKFRPVRSTYNAAYALQIVQIDHTKLDVFVVDELQRLPIGRPWLTLAIDVASRMVAGYHLSLEPPSASAVALALHHAVWRQGASRHKPIAGTPWRARSSPIRKRWRGSRRPAVWRAGCWGALHVRRSHRSGGGIRVTWRRSRDGVPEPQSCCDWPAGTAAARCRSAGRALGLVRTAHLVRHQRSTFRSKADIFRSDAAPFSGAKRIVRGQKSAFRGIFRPIAARDTRPGRSILIRDFGIRDNGGYPEYGRIGRN